MKGIEIANINTTGGGLSLADVSGWTGLTDINLSVGAAGAATVTAATTTNVGLNFISGSSSIDGGKNITIASTALGNAETITVGGTTKAVGDVTIAAISATGAGTGTIAVSTTGGATVSISDSNATTTNKQRAMNVTDGAAAATVAGTLANVTLDGYGANSLVTSNALSNLSLANSITGLTVTVTNSLTSAAAAKASVLNLNVKNLTSTTLVDTNNEIGTLNVTVSGLATQNSTLAAITDSNLSALTVTGALANTLTLTAATGLTGLKTIAVSGASNFTAAVDVSAVATGLSAVTTTGTGTVTLGATTATQGIGLATSYTGGAGKDVLTIGATTKAIDLGAGDNTLYFVTGTAAVGTGGTVVAGGGTDTLGMTVAAAVTASASSTFATKVTGFERLTLAAASANPQTVDVATLLGATNQNYVTTTGVATNVLQLSNLNASGAGATVVIKNAAATTNAGVTLNGSTGSTSSDVLNLTLSDTATTTTAAAVVTFGTIDAANVETVKITVSDARTTSVNYQSANTATITDAALQSLVVSGNQSLVLTHTAGTALTSVDASGMTVGSLSFTSNASQYATTVKGSLLGGDNLDFSAVLAAVTLTETAGANTVQGGVGADTIVGGSGADVIYADNAGANRVETVTITYSTATSNDVLTVNGVGVTFATGADLAASKAAMIAAINAEPALKNIVVASANATAGVVNITYLVDTIDTASVDTTSTNNTNTVAQITPATAGATAKNVLTGGTGADTFVFGATSVAPSDSIFNTITDFATASDIIDYAPKAITIATAASAAVSGTAAISSAGIATFAAADNTLALRIIAAENGINNGGTNAAAAGQTAVFQFGADAYAFISNGVDGVGAGDQLIKLTGVDTTTASFDTLTLANGNATLA